DLVHRMTLEEKASQLVNQARAITRLNIPAYDWWSEALHGVVADGTTEFPEPIGLAATFDTPRIHEMATAIGTEGRIVHVQALQDGNSGFFRGLDFWAPNVNIFRDPRWGRAQETYGEDPFLTGRMAVAFIQGLQGDDPNYFKVIACAKHFAAHSGPEAVRHSFNAEPPERDLYETYLPQFEAAVREGKVGAVMGAYNRLNGQPACANAWLLQDLLRGQWGFTGQVVSDCGAVYDMVHFHKVARTFEEASTLAIKAGCDLACGSEYQSLTSAVKHGLVSETEIDAS